MNHTNDYAVSPVVGVMLMLVVTIIIAAVVSGFSGSLVSGQKSSPTLSMNVQVVNTGSYLGSGFIANINGVSQPVSSSDIKIVTSWSTAMKDNTSADLYGTPLAGIPDGTVFTGGNTSLPHSGNIGGLVRYPNMNGETAPYGVGPDTPSDMVSAAHFSLSDFGNYTLQAGCSLYAWPCGESGDERAIDAPGNADPNGGYNGANPYTYASGSDYNAGITVDPTTAVLGGGWEQLRTGDTVHVKVIYMPTGAIIFSDDVPVTEA